MNAISANASSSIRPTEEQEAIIQGAQSTSSLMISAYAGCAKTTSLALLGARIRGPALALAFNKSIAEELKGRFAPNFEVRTMNGFGFGALRRAYPRVGKWELDDRKVGKLLSEAAKRAKIELMSDEWDAIRRLVSGAQNQGFAPERWDESEWKELADSLWLPIDREGLALAHEVLVENNQAIERGVISFDDQIYWPTVNDSISLPQYPTVLVDEAQDLSPLQHSMLAKALGAQSRLMVCGDSRQAIYGFRGADSASMAKIRALRPEGAWADRPLTLTFRCPKAIVARQQGHAPGFRAWPGNAEGRVIGGFKKEHESYEAVAEWEWSDVQAALPHPAATLAVLCRNNAPLFSLAFKLLRRGVGVVMLGRDLGKGLKALVTKLAPSPLPITKFISKLNDWCESECELARLNGKEAQAESARDRQECLLAIADGASARDSSDLRSAIDRVFARERGVVTLSSIHKAKGLEWDCVLHLDPWRIPSKQALRAQALRGDEGPLEQEWNLKYVAETRSKHTLIEADLRDFDGEGE